jgi:cytochrome c5
MRAPSLAAIVVVLIAGGLFVLIAISGGSRTAPAPATSSAPPSPSVSANGFALTSTAIALPDDAATYPPGPGVDLVNQRCLSCHSASMGTTQPRLTAEQWKATVEKMRDTYHAPIEPRDVPAIVSYFVAQQGGKAQPEG